MEAADRRVLLIYDLEEATTHQVRLRNPNDDEIDRHDYLRGVQPNYTPPSQFLNFQRQIDFKMRFTLLEWLHQILVEYRFASETWFLTVNYIDRFCSRHQVLREEFQLVGATCFFLAMKYEEIVPLSVEHLVALSGDAYIREQLLQKEIELLDDLSFQLSTPTIFQFLSFFISVPPMEAPMIYLANYLAELSVLCYELASAQASTVAAACLYLTLKKFNKRWTNDIRQYSGYSETSSEFLTTILILADFWFSTFEQNLRPPMISICQKYSSPGHHSVSQLEPFRIVF